MTHDRTTSGLIDAQPVSRPPELPNRINFGWLLRLRGSMVAGQLLAILGARLVLHLRLPLGPLLAIVATEAALNLAGAVLRRRHERREGWLVAIMACDIVLFTGLLYFTGGPSNPFSFLYLVQIALAAITVRPAWSWALTGLALLGSAVRFLVHSPLSMSISHAAYVELHLRGHPADSRASRSLPRHPRAHVLGRGRGIGESVEPLSVGELVGMALLGLTSPIGVVSEIPDGVRALRLWLPQRAMALALRGLLKNAQEAAPPEARFGCG